MANIFTRHPAEIGESYSEHLGAAGAFGLTLVGAGLACIVHAVLPFLFTHTASKSVHRLNRELAGKRRAELADHWVI